MILKAVKKSVLNDGGMLKTTLALILPVREIRIGQEAWVVDVFTSSLTSNVSLRMIIARPGSESARRRRAGYLTTHD